MSLPASLYTLLKWMMSVVYARRSLMKRMGCFAALWLLAASVALAQDTTPLDTTRVYEMDQVVVTADRSAGVLGAATGAVSVLRRAELKQFPLLNLSDALTWTPGFAFVNLDGLGYDPQAMVRGFYGGGEAEYVVMLLNGRPLNNLEAGLLNWNQLPLASVESIEVLRGGVSSLYGDAAIGGVVNVVTSDEVGPVKRVTVTAGSFGSFDGQAAINGMLSRSGFSIFGNVLGTNGYRDHAERTSGSLGGTLNLLRDNQHKLTLNALNHWRTFEVPGPLTTAELDESRVQGAPLYRFDETEEYTGRLGVDGTAQISPTTQLDGSLTGELRKADIVRTLPLSASFADTKNRQLDATRLLASSQLTYEPELEFRSKLIVGADASVGSLGTEYFNVVTGGAETYSMATGERGEKVAEGTGRRSTAAAFAQLDLYPVSRVRLTLGSRFDWIRDTFEPEMPTGEESTTTNTAFSPKIGLNLRYMQTARQVGNWYAAVARSFKAPTLDQLYDQRAFPFGENSITISNPDLKPQNGTSFETGVYHRATLVPGQLATELSLSVYQIDMTDEIDFSFETFSNVNIGESRHRGIESGLKMYVGSSVTAFVNYTLQEVTFQFGENEGNYVKAIPRDFISSGVRAAHRSGFGGSVTLNSARRIFLDDANTIRLPDYTTVALRLSYEQRPFTLFGEAFNLFDATYSTTGFPDPAGEGVVFLYPAAGRVLQVGLNVVL